MLIISSLTVLFLLSLASPGFTQYVYTIKADSVKITNCDSAELIVENHTQVVPGFLYNTGNGRTIFKHGLIKLNDSQYVSGADTLNLNQVLAALLKAGNGLSLSGGKVVLGNDMGDSSAKLLSNRVIPLAGRAITLQDNGSVNQTSLGAGNLYLTETVEDRLLFQTPINIFASHDFTNSNPNSIAYFPSIAASNTLTPHGSLTNSGLEYRGIEMSDYFAPYDTGRFSYTGVSVEPTYDFTNPLTTNGSLSALRGFYYYPLVLGTSPYRNIAYENDNGDNIFNSGRISNSGQTKGKAGFQGVITPTAYVHIGAGAAAAGSAPLKLNTGVLLTTPENGAIEYDGADLYLTKAGTRYKLVKALTGQLSTNFGGSSLSASDAVTATLSVTGVQPGDVVSVNANSGAVNPPQVIITAFVTTANTVTIQAFNAGSTSVTLASDTYKVKILQ